MNEEFTKRLAAELIAWGVVIGCCAVAILAGVGLTLWSMA